MEPIAGFPNLGNEQENGAFRGGGHATGRPDGAAFDEGLNDGGLPWRCELVHRIRMRERSRIVQGVKKGPHLAPFQRASAALRALWLRCRFVIFAALAGPPFLPPKRPKATAAGFL